MLTSVDVGAQRVADDAGGPLHLGVGVLVVGRADDEAQPMRKANYASLVTLALWSTKSASGKPAQGTEDSEPARPPASPWCAGASAHTQRCRRPGQRRGRRTSDPVLACPKGALSAAVEEAATHLTRIDVRAGSMTGVPFKSTSLPKAAAAPRRMCLKIGSRSSSVAKVWTNVGERKKSFEGTGGSGA